MVDLQIINKVLSDKSIAILTANNITKDYFPQYQNEIEYILKHFERFNCVPDVETFLSKFPNFDLINVQESNEYLIDTIREEYMYSKTVPILSKMSELMQTNTNDAVEYLKTQLPYLKVEQSAKGVDIISNGMDRYNEYVSVNNDIGSNYISSGFPELDSVTGGFHCGEEFVVVFSRSGQGKTWSVIKMAEHMWSCGKRVGFLEPEMSANRIGYRFDTLHANISNTDLLRGNYINSYETYINNLIKTENPFLVTHPKDFQRNITVSKLKSWVEYNKLDVLIVDGITYLNDERRERNDSRTIQLTHISEDLMDLSIELSIPVIVVCQSNREGAKQDDLSLENIRDSDGIAYNASLVLSIAQKEQGLQIAIVKSRNSSNRAKLTYLWDIDCGKFQYIPSTDSGIDDKELADELRRSFDDEESEF